MAARDNVEVGVVNDLNSQLKRVEHELASIRSAHWRNSILVAFWKQSSIFATKLFSSSELIETKWPPKLLQMESASFQLDEKLEI